MSEFKTKLKPHPEQWKFFSKVLEDVRTDLHNLEYNPDEAKRMSIKKVIQKQFEVLYGRYD